MDSQIGSFKEGTRNAGNLAAKKQKKTEVEDRGRRRVTGRCKDVANSAEMGTCGPPTVNAGLSDLLLDILSKIVSPRTIGSHI